MAKKPGSSVLAAWLNRQAQPQADGTYLVRSFPFVYQVDTGTKDRWVRFLLAYRRFNLIAMVTFFIVAHGQVWGLTWGLASLAAVILPVGYGGRFIVLRGAKRVSRDRWQGPAVIDRFGRHSRRFYVVMMIVCLLMDTLIIQLVWTQWHKLDAATLWSTAPVVALFTTCGVVMMIGYRRTAPKAG
jgi:hypothetical protein